MWMAFAEHFGRSPTMMAGQLAIRGGFCLTALRRQELRGEDGEILMIPDMSPASRTYVNASFDAKHCGSLLGA